jgi:hypothetical protein
MSDESFGLYVRRDAATGRWRWRAKIKTPTGMLQTGGTESTKKMAWDEAVRSLQGGEEVMNEFRRADHEEG